MTSVDMFAVGVAGAKVIYQRPFRVQWPVTIRQLLLLTVTVNLLKWAMHSASHSWTMDRREPNCSCGKRWAWQANKGRWGSGRRQVCVELLMVLPLGRVILMGWLVGQMLLQWLLAIKNGLLAPVSASTKVQHCGEGLEKLQITCKLVFSTIR